MNDYIEGNRVFSQSKSQFKQAWIFAILWNALIWYAIIMGGQNILQAFDANPIFYFFVTFPFIGLWLVIYAIKETRAWYKFGKTPLFLDPFPGQIGGRFTGYLDLPLSHLNAQQAIFSLSCIRRYSQRDSQGENHWHEDVLWQDRASFKPDSLANNIRIDFLFNTPSDLPASEDEMDDYHFWQLHVRLPLPGIDYDRVFNVPMEVASEQQLASTERYKAKVSQRIEHQDTDVADVPKIENTAAGLQFYYGYGRSIGMAIALLMFGGFFGVFGYYFFDGFLDFLPVTAGVMAASVGLIAFVFSFLGMLLLANSLSIEVNLMGIRKKQKLFGFLLEEFTDAVDIVDIVVEQNASSGNGRTQRIWYRLKLLTADGQNMEVGDSLEGQAYANEIRQKMIDALGMTWQAATLNASQNKVKKPLPFWVRMIGKVLSYSFVIALLYDLSIKIPQVSEFLSKVFE